MRASTTKRAVVAALTISLLLVPLGAASAGSSSHSRSSGQTASAEWTEFGELPGGVAGNVHVGSLFVDASSRGPADIFGSVTDWTCEEGEVPGGGGHGVVEDEPVEGECDFEGVRFISNEGATFTMDRKATQASLVGPLRVEGHDGGGAAFPNANMTWTAVGSPYSYRVTESFSDGTYSYTYRYTFSGSDSTIGGAIGAMGFTDDDDDESFGSLGTYRNMYRDRVR